MRAINLLLALAAVLITAAASPTKKDTPKADFVTPSSGSLQEDATKPRPNITFFSHIVTNASADCKLNESSDFQFAIIGREACFLVDTRETAKHVLFGSKSNCQVYLNKGDIDECGNKHLGSRLEIGKCHTIPKVGHLWNVKIFCKEDGLEEPSVEEVETDKSVGQRATKDDVVVSYSKEVEIIPSINTQLNTEAPSYPNITLLFSPIHDKSAECKINTTDFQTMNATYSSACFLLNTTEYGALYTQVKSDDGDCKVYLNKGDYWDDELCVKHDPKSLIPMDECHKLPKVVLPEVDDGWWAFHVRCGEGRSVEEVKRDKYVVQRATRDIGSTSLKPTMSLDEKPSSTVTTQWSFTPPPSPTGRYVHAYLATKDDCSYGSTWIEQFDGGDYGDREFTKCVDFNTHAWPALTMEVAGCSAYIQKGRCSEKGAARKQVHACKNRCTPAFLEDRSPEWQSLVVHCSESTEHNRCPVESTTSSKSIQATATVQGAMAYPELTQTEEPMVVASLAYSCPIAYGTAAHIDQARDGDCLWYEYNGDFSIMIETIGDCQAFLQPGHFCTPVPPESALLNPGECYSLDNPAGWTLQVQCSYASSGQDSELKPIVPTTTIALEEKVTKVSARQETPSSTDDRRYLDLSYALDDCAGNEAKKQYFDGGKYGDDDIEACVNFDTSMWRSFGIIESAGCVAYFQDSICDANPAHKRFLLREGCGEPFLEPGAPTSQSFVIFCGDSARDRSMINARRGADSVAANPLSPASTWPPPPPIPVDKRALVIYGSELEICPVDHSNHSVVWEFVGGDFGAPTYTKCHDFDAGSVRSLYTHVYLGCHAYIQAGSCAAGGKQRPLAGWNGCTQPFLGVGEPTGQSLLVICDAGKSARAASGPSASSVSKRSNTAVSEYSADPRYVEFWVTYGIECTRDAEPLTISSGTFGEGWTEACADQGPMTREVRVVAQLHGCDFWLQQGCCDCENSLPLYIPELRCTQTPGDWVGSAWSAKVSCGS